MIYIIIIMKFNETDFIKDIVRDYIKSNDNDYSITYNNHFNRLLKNYNIIDIYKLYLNEIDIEDSKYRYGNNYMEIKINLILYSKFINYMIDNKKNI